MNIFTSDVILIHPRLQSESDIIPDIVTGIGNGLRMKSGQTSGESTPTKTTCSVFTAVSLTNDYICLYSAVVCLSSCRGVSVAESLIQFEFRRTCYLSIAR